MDMQALSSGEADDLQWTQAIANVNAWRGASMQCFAQVEAAVTETLLFLHEAPSLDIAVRLRHLVGQRLEDLALALGPEGALASKGEVALRALEAFRMHEGFRTHLAHDVAKIALDRNGKWVVVFRQLAIRNRKPERGTHAYEQTDAERILAEIRRKTQRLCSALANLRQNIERTSAS